MAQSYKEARSDNGNLQYQVYYLDKEMSIYHNETGPSLIIYNDNGNKSYEVYYLNNKQHNLNGPAKIYYRNNGEIENKEYFINNVWLKNINSNEELKQYILLNDIK